MIIESVKHPFKSVIIPRHSRKNGRKRVEEHNAYGIFDRGSNSNNTEEYLKHLESQNKILQEKIDENNNNLKLSRINTGIIFFFCILILLALSGLFVSSIFFDDPLNKSQIILINVCQEMLKLLITALASFLGGKSIK